MTRIQVETRIFKILEYIHHPIIPALKQNLELFSVVELSQILSFLETGSLNPIQQFLTEKIQEYKGLLEELRMNKAFGKLKTHKMKELEERELEQSEAEEMIRFD
ncbi:hypothetical protein LR004_02640 [Candidatus Gracilibacteria bacterium]|nr:hypothetical protein [Candidatus Gracilibacteria bacterium]